jgi:hypothetical protein
MECKNGGRQMLKATLAAWVGQRSLDDKEHTVCLTALDSESDEKGMTSRAYA